MKREPLKGGITRVTLASGKVRYEARWSSMDANGKRVPGRSRHDTLKEAQQHRARQITAIADGRGRGASRLTVDEYFVTWFTRRARDWADSTAYTREHQYNRHVRPRLGKLRLTQLNRSRVQAMVDDLAAQWAPANVRSIMAGVSGLLGGAVRDGHIATNPAQGLDLPAVRHVDHEVWTEAEVIRFLTHTRGHRHWPIYALLLATGMRIGEALALRWENVDLERGTVTIMDTVQRTRSGSRKPAQGVKTEAARRTIPLSPGILKTLRSMARPSGFVFLNRRGHHVGDAEVALQLKAVQAELGEDWTVLTPHGMRHTVGTNLMRAGVHPTVVKELLGHSQITVTLDSYSHPALADLKAAIEVTGAVVDGTIDHDNTDDSEGE